MLRRIPLSDIIPNPNQPRKTFEKKALRELAASIQANGLMQPITVTPRAGAFMIVGGERRWRAHCLLAEEGRLEEANMLCHVRRMDDDSVSIMAIIENLQRQDVTIMEEARAYQAMLDQGWTVEDLAREVGVSQPHRIKERTQLLNMSPEYQKLFEAGQLTPSQAWELSRLQPNGQDILFRLIRQGTLSTKAALTAAADQIIQKSAQTCILNDLDHPETSPKDVRLAKSLEAKIDRLVGLLAECIVNNEVDALKRVDPTRAGTVADKLNAMRKDMSRVENALRAASVQNLI